jgi:hypothetical protein
MTVTRVSLGKKKLVYVIQAQKALKYPWGRSRIAYVGTTKKGMARFAQSAAAKAEGVLKLHGVREMEVRIITCGVRRNVRTWAKLERAMLLTFRQTYGAVPKCNTAGKKTHERDEFRYFKRERIKSILESLA